MSDATNTLNVLLTDVNDLKNKLTDIAGQVTTKVASTAAADKAVVTEDERLAQAAVVAKAKALVAEAKAIIANFRL